MPAHVLAIVLLFADGRGGGEKQAVWTAIDDVRRTVALYEAVLAQQPKHRMGPFGRILRHKRRHERRLVKLAVRRGLGDPPVLWDRAAVTAPGERKPACARAVDQELRNAAIYETAMGLPLSAATLRTMRSIHRRVRNRHIPAFEACVRLA